jgi:ribosomal subunit interface protein
MQLSVHGKQMDLGDALRTHVSDKLDDINQKYFNHATEATVTFAPEGHGHGLVKTHISIRVGKDIMVMSDAAEADPYISFDVASEKVAKQLRRYKRRLRDHKKRMDDTPETEMLKARDYVLTSETEAEEPAQDADAVVVAEISTSIQTLTVSEAVMRMDLSGQPALMFRNANHKGLNMVYRRTDGHVGWLDPEGNECAVNLGRKSA